MYGEHEVGGPGWLCLAAVPFEQLGFRTDLGTTPYPEYTKDYLAAVLSLVGIVLNRLNVSVIAFDWQALVRYYPSWMEIVVTLMVVFAEIWVFRWVVTRMPVLRAAPWSPTAT